MQNKGNLFFHYLRKGGFPVIHTADYPDESAYKVVYDIYSSVIFRDTVQRYKIRDVELLERVIKYAFDNIGNTFSGKNVADYFKSQQRKVERGKCLGSNPSLPVYAACGDAWLYRLEFDATHVGVLPGLPEFTHRYIRVLVILQYITGENIARCRFK